MNMDLSVWRQSHPFGNAVSVSRPLLRSISVHIKSMRNGLTTITSVKSSAFASILPRRKSLASILPPRVHLAAEVSGNGLRPRDWSRPPSRSKASWTWTLLPRDAKHRKRKSAAKLSRTQQQWYPTKPRSSSNRSSHQYATSPSYRPFSAHHRCSFPNAFEHVNGYWKRILVDTHLGPYRSSSPACFRSYCLFSQTEICAK